MHSFFTPSRSHSRPRRHGFALISSIVLLGVLGLIILAIVLQSQQLQQKSTQETADSIAQRNALLGLETALAQLQLHCGTDQSTTCRADLLDSRAEVNDLPDPQLLHPYYTAAFQTQPVDGDYNHAAYGNGVFLRTIKGKPHYLVSGNELFNLSAESPDLTGYTTARTRIPPHRAVELSSAPHSEAPAVTVPKVSLPNKGHYAYWISDENLKARINLKGKSAEDSQHATYNQLQAPSALGAANHPFLTELHTPDQHLSLCSLALQNNTNTAQILRHKHAITPHSRSVLCDQKHGGLKKNLSAAANLSSAAFATLTKEKGTPEQGPMFLFERWAFPPERDELSYSHYPGAPWELFRSYIRRAEFEPDLNAKKPTALSHLGSAAYQLANYWQTRSDPSYTGNLRPPTDARLVRRSPTILRYQIGIDYSARYLGTVNDEQIGLSHEFALQQHFIPLIAFWNPYDVDLAVSESIELHTYLDRHASSGRHNTHFLAHIPHGVSWRVLALHQDSHKEKPRFSGKRNGPSTFYYPYSPQGNAAKKSRLARHSFYVPPFQLSAGATALFTVGETNQLMQVSKSGANKLKRATNHNHAGHSFYTSNAKIRIAATHFTDPLAALPPLEILAFPSQHGNARTRLQVKNTSSFQRINWNFADITQAAKIRFIPTLWEPSQPLPLSDANGSSSPKVSAVLIRKFPDIAHYSSHHWKSPTGTIDSNSYTAPWSLFYHHNASRYGAYGAESASDTSFSSPPQYLSGIVLGNSPILHPDLSPTGQPFVGHSDRAATGSTHAIQHNLPRSHLRTFSPAHLSQMNLTKWVYNYHHQHSNASASDALIPSFSIGNSFCSPHIAPGKTSTEVHDIHAYSSSPTATQYDASFRYNEALWDRYFFTAEPSAPTITAETIHTQRQAKHLQALPNATVNKLLNPHQSASQLMLEGGFNVNSTSVEAWKILLTSTLQKTPDSQKSATKAHYAFPRSYATPSQPYHTPPSDPSDSKYYDGSHHRALTADEIHTLAQQIVRQNKLRGPYASLAQFINRSLSPDHHFRKTQQNLPLNTTQVCYEGPLQAAINSAKINGAFHTSNAEFPSELTISEENHSGFEKGRINPAALKYHSGYGAPGTLTQADLLNRIGHRLTARSDTFIVRAYGDATDQHGKTRSKAYCEAVVQRFPEYMHSQDSPSTPPSIWQLSSYSKVPHHGTFTPNSELHPLSKKLGRRFRILHFRWLNPAEL